MNMIVIALVAIVSAIIGAIINGMRWKKYATNHLRDTVKNALYVYDEGGYEVQKKASEVICERYINNGIDQGTRLVIRLVPDMK